MDELFWQHPDAEATLVKLAASVARVSREPAVREGNPGGKR